MHSRRALVMRNLGDTVGVVLLSLNMNWVSEYVRTTKLCSVRPGVYIMNSSALHCIRTNRLSSSLHLMRTNRVSSSLHLIRTNRVSSSLQLIRTNRVSSSLQLNRTNRVVIHYIYSGQIR